MILRDIYWVFWRELKKLLRQRLRILMAVVQPTVWLALMGNAMSGLTANPVAARMLGTGNYLEFMTPGVMVMTSLFGGVYGGTSVLWDRRLGFLNKMLTSPLHRAAIPLGKLLALLVQSLFQVLLIAIIALLLGVRFATGLAGILFLLLLSGLFGMIMGGISLALAARIKSHETLFAIMNFFTMPLMFTSNALYPTRAMPSWLQKIAAYNPLSFAVTPMRTVATRGWVWGDILPGLAALLLMVVLVVALAVHQFSRSVD